MAQRQLKFDVLNLRFNFLGNWKENRDDDLLTEQNDIFKLEVISSDPLAYQMGTGKKRTPTSYQISLVQEELPKYLGDEKSRIIRMETDMDLDSPLSDFQNLFSKFRTESLGIKLLVEKEYLLHLKQKSLNDTYNSGTLRRYKRNTPIRKDLGESLRALEIQLLDPKSLDPLTIRSVLEPQFRK